MDLIKKDSRLSIIAWLSMPDWKKSMMLEAHNKLQLRKRRKRRRKRHRKTLKQTSRMRAMMWGWQRPVQTH